MADPFVAEIRPFGFNFAPTGWAQCNGQLMPISQNTALFSLVGTFYGGDGKSTFALPDLVGNAPMHPGQGSGLSLRDLGETGGAQTVTLLESEMPAHTHVMRCATQDNADVSIPSPNSSFAQSAGGELYQTTANTNLAFQALAPVGGSLPHNNLMPYLVLNFCIALQGVYPQRP
ncbi:MAG TPA: tail fiber protein [Frankiaceae bacterium]|nr:tail fiber protein [Frankiaceae bacterium]